MKKFLASVGKGVLFAKQGGSLQMVAHVDTLTESTLGITSTQEEVRAGQGAKLYGRFNHDAGLTVTLTDAMFDLNYIALQVGAELQKGAYVLASDSVTVSAGGSVTLSSTPMPIGNACGLEKAIVWYREAGCSKDDEYKSYEFTSNPSSAMFTIPGLAAGDYCFQYFSEEVSATKILVNANFVPAELVLVLTTKLFAGDASAPETGRPVGEITIKIPRFSLDGAFDLSMAMSSAATMSLNGTALATDDGSCDGEGIYAEIVEVIEGSVWFTNLDRMIVDDEGMDYPAAPEFADLNGKTFIVYGIDKNVKTPYHIPNKDLDFEVSEGATGVTVSADGVISTTDVAIPAGSKITITPKPIQIKGANGSTTTINPTEDMKVEFELPTYTPGG